MEEAAEPLAAPAGDMVAESSAELPPVAEVADAIAVEAAPEAVEAPSEWRLERRSSGDAAPIVEPLEPAPIPAETAAEHDAAEAAHHLGSPAAESEAAIHEKAAVLKTAAQEIAVAPVSVAAPPVADHAIEDGKPAGVKRKTKTLFKLWLDLTFGRKE